MQSPKKDNEKTALPKEELSATWQALLGLQGSAEQQPLPSEAEEHIEPLTSDPWSSLLHENGMQTVDLQQTHLHHAQGLDQDDSEIEQALDLMREATGKRPIVQENKTKDA